MKPEDVMRAWWKILKGGRPALSIEITRECPLRCPGCYAYEDKHIDTEGKLTLRQLADYKGNELVERVCELVKQYRPLHLSIVGGDPLVRFRELEVLLPKLDAMGIAVQLVTSAFRPLPKFAPPLCRLDTVVSIDGLQPEHDKRRAPATYERILKNIEGQKITVHCTLTGQMLKRDGYTEEFIRFWSAREEVKRIWVSIFTPQRGATSPECPTLPERHRAVADLLRLRKRYPKLDMGEKLIGQFLCPPQSPQECIFAQTTRTLSADLKTEIVPCQFGGDPDCARCGCVASMGFAAVGNTRLLPGIPLGKIFRISQRIGKTLSWLARP